MTFPLRVLLLEDSPDDAELILYELRKADYMPDWRRVETEQAYLTALAWQPDIILADYTLPQFNALQALHLLQERQLDIAFIVVTNSISEEIAVRCVQDGADDYLLKDRLTRLGSAVAHALEQQKNRRQRKKAEVALQHSEMLNRTILDAVSNHIAVLDREGKIILTNSAWARFAQENSDAGLLVRARVGTNYLDLCRQIKGEEREIAKAALEGMQAVLHGQQQEFVLEYLCRLPTHNQWFLLQATPMPSKLGGAVISHIDITERKQTEERLRQQDRLSVVGQLAAGIAHDFNNILSVITLYSQLLLKSPHLVDGEAERLQTINKQAHRAARLIAQIMDFSRQSIMERQPLEVKSFLTSLVALLKRTLPEHIRIKLNCEHRDLLIQGDLTRLEQVFMNLAVNARDAMPTGGSLQLDVAVLTVELNQTPPIPEMPPGQWVRIAVTDSGTGIPTKNLPYIFEPFFTTKGRNKGTGLGLAQVYGIIKQHDGFIEVESQPSEGTTFTLYLPALIVPEIAAPARLAEPEIAGHGETILVVEDDRVTREAAVSTLEMLNYEVLAARNGKDALALFDQHEEQIDLVLSDMVMPAMDGMTLYRQLKQKCPAIKMIIMTGYAADLPSSDLTRLGIIDWLPKPFDMDQIAKAIKKAL